MSAFFKFLGIVGLIVVAILVFPILLPVFLLMIINVLRRADAYLSGPSYLDDSGKGYYRVDNPYEND